MAVGSKTDNVSDIFFLPVGGGILVWHCLLFLAIFAIIVNRTTGGGNAKATASHILVATAEECATIRKALDATDDAAEIASLFSALAEKYSTCPSGKRSGGSLGSFGPGQMVRAFEDVVWEAPIGAVQGPVQTQFGYHLILVTERHIPGDVEYDKKNA